MKVVIADNLGFIDTALIRFLLNITEHQLINVDKLTSVSHIEELDIRKTMKCYLENQTWYTGTQDDSYQRERLGNTL